MRRWVAGSVATILVNASTYAATQPRATDDPPVRSTAAVTKTAAPKSDPSDAPGDFPPPIDAPLPANAELDALNERPVQAKPAVRSTILPPTIPTILSAPPPSPLTAMKIDVEPGRAPGCAAGSPTVDWPAPEGRNTGRIYGSVDCMLLWARKGTNPPLVQTMSPENANISLATGEVPANATSDLFGGDGTDPGAFSGVKGTLGLWLDSCSEWGVELGYTQIFRKSDKFSTESPGVPVIGRNFFDVAEGRTAFLFFSQPNGSQRGFINIDAPTQAQGGEFNVRYHGLAIVADRNEYLLGFRYFNLRDAIGINSGADFFNPLGQVTSHYDSFEFFRARNDFYGGQVGIDSHFYFGCWTVDTSSKVALGNVRQDVLIQGGTTLTQPGLPVQNFPDQSLLFVQPTNVGVYHRDRFAALPEFSVKLGYQLTQKIRATIGYEFIAISKVVRAGSAIDQGVNPNNTQFLIARQPSNALNPTFNFSDSNWWAQGLTAGFAINY